MIFELPIDPDFQRFRYTVDLDGSVFGLRWIWSERAQQWFVDVETEDGTPVRSGLAVVAVMPLLRKVLDTERPDGDLVILHDVRQPLDPGRSDLGASHPVLYLDAETVQDATS